MLCGKEKLCPCRELNAGRLAYPEREREMRKCLDVADIKPRFLGATIPYCP
jgi:hypothetical protein